MTWRITHTDTRGRRRRLRVLASSNRLAMAWAVQLLGDARAMSCIRLGA